MPSTHVSVIVCALLAASASPPSLLSQNIHPTSPPEVRAMPLQGSIHLDGRLDEAIWEAAPAASDMRQAQPHAGEPATQRTEVRFTYDDAAIYVGARMYDDSGAAGVRTRLARRDADISTDYIQVIFDTYHDHIGRLFFSVNPSGVLQDANGLGGGGDPSWDPVWEAKTNIDSLGWTAEMRIPFSQLRYPNTSQEQTWGLQIWRQENRLNELSMWAYWAPDESGGPARFGHLSGLVIHKAPGRGEVMPYVLGQTARAPGNPADPFYDATALDGRVGGDATLRVTSNLTLNATINPDFGQVEVDPAVVNLSAYETFLQEKRPFFVEGAGYFGLGGLNCYFCSNVSSLSMLNTRRIGRAPQVSPWRTDSVAFADAPQTSAILGAGKLTGRTPSGWSLGALEAVTKHERAPVQMEDGTQGTFTVEPLTNYFTTRVAKDVRGGATQFKAMFTSVYRNLDDPYVASRLSEHSEAGGVSVDSWWHKRTYRLMAQLAASNVHGDTAAMRRIRFGSAHYFQRPDRADPADARAPRTGMSGVGGYARVSKESGHWLWEASTNFRTPAFNNNDITFFSRADYIWMGANLFPQWTKATSWFRQLYLIGGGQQQYNFEGDRTDRQLHAFAQMQTLFYWWFTAFYIHRPEVFDDRQTRGGPTVKRPGINYVYAGFNTDSRKKLSAQFNTDRGCNTEGDCDHSIGVALQIQPRPNVSISLGPSLAHQETGFQYVDSYADPTDVLFYGKRYIFANLEQQSISMDTRLNWTFSPMLTLELFLQPLIASGSYSHYNVYAAPRTAQRLEYGRDFGTVVVTPTSDPEHNPASVTVDADTLNGGAPSYTFTDPTFTVRSLRGNAVLRWEYRPGSTLYLVWTHTSQLPDLARGSIAFHEDAGDLFHGPSENILLVKVSYWLGL